MQPKDILHFIQEEQQKGNAGKFITFPGPITYNLVGWLQENGYQVHLMQASLKIPFPDEDPLYFS